MDKKNWLFLLCQDLYFTTEQVLFDIREMEILNTKKLFFLINQAQGIINRFKKKRTIGAGGLTVLDILKR